MRFKNKIILGVTGSMSSGKSTVAKIFEELGAKRISADEVAHFFTSKDSPVQNELLEILDSSCLNEDGSFDRKKIGKIVFNSPEKLKQLNDLLHPMIRKKTLEEFGKFEGLVVWEAPLLFETNGQEICDYVLTVWMEYSQALEKVSKRDKITENEFKKRLENQMDVKEKIKLSDFIVENNSSIENLKLKTKEIFDKLTF
jgi:dephospho-CoA kinase